jgi:hypothetical protein
MRERSLKAHQTKAVTVNDTTYQARLWPSSPASEQVLQAELEKCGRLKTKDLSKAQKEYNRTRVIPERDPRVKLLTSQGLTGREARQVVEANNDVLDAASKVNKLNTAHWQKEQEAAPDHYKPKYAKKINKAQDLSICLGGKSLFRLAQADPTALKEWRDRRLYLAAGGEGLAKLGNNTIRLVHLRDSQFEVWLKPIQGKFFQVGTVNFKRSAAAQAILSAQSDKKPVAAQILKRKGIYKLHVTPTASSAALVTNSKWDKSSNRRGSMDFNDGHVDVCIADGRGNPLEHSTFYYSSGRTVHFAVRQAFAYLRSRHASSLTIEQLGGLNKNCSATYSGNSNSYMRRVANQLPQAVFRDCASREARACGMELIAINPKNTSKHTKFWPEQEFGLDVHQKASYLILRKGLGYQTRRRARAPANSLRIVSPATISKAKSSLLPGGSTTKSQKRESDLPSLPPFGVSRGLLGSSLE